MSETSNKPPSRDRLTQEVVLAVAPDILRTAMDRMLAIRSRPRMANQEGNPTIEDLLGSGELQNTSNLVNGSKHIIVDEQIEYVIEKRSYQDFVEVVLTRFPFHPMKGAGIVSEGIRIKINKLGKGESFIEYHLREKGEKGESIPSNPFKNTREALRLALAFVQSI
jgi:hypothetical protein